MILTDDNFASIVRAVAEGRTIYANIRKVVGFLLSCNIGEILVIFLAMLTNLPTPLVAIQLLSINLITDAFPAFALGMEKEEPGTMNRKPRDPSEPIVDKKMTVAVLIQSVALALGTLGSSSMDCLFMTLWRLREPPASSPWFWASCCALTPHVPNPPPSLR